MMSSPRRPPGGVDAIGGGAAFVPPSAAPGSPGPSHPRAPHVGRWPASASVMAWQLPFAALVLAGWVGGVEGARNVAVFAVWGFLLPLGLACALSVALQALLALGSDLPLPMRAVFHAINLACLGVLVWHGATVTAVAFAAYMAASLVATAAVQRMRALLNELVQR